MDSPRTFQSQIMIRSDSITHVDVCAQSLYNSIDRLMTPMTCVSWCAPSNWVYRGRMLVSTNSIKSKLTLSSLILFEYYFCKINVLCLILQENQRYYGWEQCKSEFLEAWILASRPKTLTGAAVPVMIGNGFCAAWSVWQINVIPAILKFPFCFCRADRREFCEWLFRFCSGQWRWDPSRSP